MVMLYGWREGDREGVATMPITGGRVVGYCINNSFVRCPGGGGGGGFVEKVTRHARHRD